MLSHKAYIKYILFNTQYSCIQNTTTSPKSTNIILSSDLLYYVILHTRLSSLFYTTTLIDIFSYELPVLQNKPLKNIDKDFSDIVVYNLQVLQTQERLVFFTNSTYLTSKLKNLSITEIFPAANWLEREVAELHGIYFLGKKDIRNLMLQYGDTTNPLKKVVPSVGLSEVYYTPINDTLTQFPVSLQI